MEYKYIEIKQFGDARLLKVETKSFDENIRDDEVIVDVKYSGINFADIVMRLGQYRDAPSRPFIPGYEVSGIISKVGSAITKFKIGDEVMAGTRFGGYASKIKIPSLQVMNLPQGLSLEEAAALPVNLVTAQIALGDFARVRRDDKVLLDCATGGVGVVAMQMCKAAGAKCIGLTTSPAKKEFIESYGAKAYTFEEFEKSDESDFTFILNSSGGSSVKSQYSRLSKSGLICCIGMQASINDGKSNMFAYLKTVLSTPWYPLVKLIMQSRSVGGFNALKYFEDDKWLLKNLPMVEKSTFKPHVGRVFSANEVTQAHEFLEQKKARGKVLLKWD